MARKPRTAAEHLAEIAARLAARAANPRPAPHPERVFRHAIRTAVDRDGIGGNGGPPLDAPPPDRRATLHRIATSLFGERWKEEASLPLGVSARTLRRYVQDDRPVPVPDAVIHAMRRACAARASQLHTFIATLDSIVPPPPPPPPPPEPLAPTTPKRQPCDPRQVDLEDWLNATKA